jgi:uncharacterized membrane protein
MTTDVVRKWEQILETVDKNKIPVHFIKKLVVKLEGKRQHTINISKLSAQGLDPEQLEDVVSKKLQELDPIMVSVEFVLDVEVIAETIQPTTDELLRNL